MDPETCINCGYHNTEAISTDHPCARCSYTKSPAEHDADEERHEADRVAAAKELFPVADAAPKEDAAEQSQAEKQSQAEVPAAAASGPMPTAEAPPSVAGVAVLIATEAAPVLTATEAAPSEIVA